MCDEGVDRHVVDRLRSDGHGVGYVAEMEPGIPDTAVLRLADQSSAILITFDKDFGDLVLRHGQPSAGVLLVRLAGVSRERRAALVAAAIDEHADEIAGTFTVISPGRVRIRRPPGAGAP